jgi:hypothetical protein
MIHEKLVELHEPMCRLANGGDDRATQSLIALAVIGTAITSEFHEGLTLMVRQGDEKSPPEVVVFESDGSRKDAIRYGGIGDPKDIKVVGGDGPLTFIVGLCLVAHAAQIPLPEVVEMLIALAKAVFADYHESKEKRDER